MPITPTRVVLLLSLALLLAVTWYVDGRRQWRERASSRLLYGVPWGTAVTVAIVVGFYLLVQGGFRHWDEPVMYPFITWSYFYPEGLVTAGLAHAGPGHLVSNMTATVVFGAIAEYAWGHYPDPDSRRADAVSDERPLEDGIRPDGGREPLLARPWVRAFVVFPVALLVTAFLTAVFSLGPGLGFSGAVYAIVGFVVVLAPVAAIVALAVTSGLGLVIDALSTPIVRETVEVGPPVPPGWAGVGFHAHLLGFLIGASVAVAVVSRRGRHPPFATLAFGVFVVGAVQALWLVALGGGDDEFVLYRGAGVVMVAGLALVVASAVAGSERPIPAPLERFSWVPSRRTLSVGWLLAVAVFAVLGIVGAIVVGEAVGFSIGVSLVLAALLAVPALPTVLPDRLVPTPVSRRHAAVTVLVVATLLLAVVSVPVGLTVVEDDSVPGTEAMTVDDYSVTYAQNATSGQEWVIDLGEDEFEATNVSGVILVNDDREMWTVGVTDDLLAFEGEANVTVGGVDWRETVHIERTGWEVVGNETVYAVDLEAERDGEATRVYTSGPARANAEIAGQTIDVVPTDDGFDLEVTAGEGVVGTTQVPEIGESTAVDDLAFRTVEEHDAVSVLVEADDVRLQVAERETYPSG
ncbi:rhomboid family intramembrane serine protease [Natrialbaceae archaeon A-gly3]